jgi:ABC-type sulfate/molybdate transport systems ATPase subunit
MTTLPASSKLQTSASAPWLALRVAHRFTALSLDVDCVCAAPWTVLFGPSGCGKTTLLRSVAGLFTPDAGRIHLYGQTLFERAIGRKTAVHLPPQERRIGLVAQSPALFPHWTAAENLAFALRTDSTKRAEKVQSLLHRFGAETLAAQYPRQLSGGEQQRIALARTLAAEPRALLLDEPFSAMDRISRQQALDGLRTWVRERGTPVLMVTHDLAEAFDAGDEVLTMDNGRITAQGSADLVLRDARAHLLRQLGV